MKQASRPAMRTPGAAQAAAVERFAHVRHQVSDMERAIAFYTQQLGFTLESQSGKVFASVTRGKLRLILGGRSGSGARPLQDGRVQQASEGWNRVVIHVADLRAEMNRLKTQGVRFRNEVESGPAGSRVQIEDPDGNPIDLRETPKGSPASR